MYTYLALQQGRYTETMLQPIMLLTNSNMLSCTHTLTVLQLHFNFTSLLIRHLLLKWWHFYHHKSPILVGRTFRILSGYTAIYSIVMTRRKSETNIFSGSNIVPINVYPKHLWKPWTIPARFHNDRNLLMIFCTLPVTTCTAERAFSAMKILKSYLWN